MSRNILTICWRRAGNRTSGTEEWDVGRNGEKMVKKGCELGRRRRNARVLGRLKNGKDPSRRCLSHDKSPRKQSNAIKILESDSIDKKEITDKLTSKIGAKKQEDEVRGRRDSKRRLCCAAGPALRWRGHQEFETSMTRGCREENEGRPFWVRRGGMQKHFVCGKRLPEFLKSQKMSTVQAGYEGSLDLDLLALFSTNRLLFLSNIDFENFLVSLEAFHTKKRRIRTELYIFGIALHCLLKETLELWRNQKNSPEKKRARPTQNKLKTFKHKNHNTVARALVWKESIREHPAPRPLTDFEIANFRSLAKNCHYVGIMKFDTKSHRQETPPKIAFVCSLLFEGLFSSVTWVM